MYLRGWLGGVQHFAGVKRHTSTLFNPEYDPAFATGIMPARSAYSILGFDWISTLDVPPVRSTELHHGYLQESRKDTAEKLVSLDHCPQP
jgi:hypothetical protein